MEDIIAYRFFRKLIKPFFIILFRPTIIGIENIPAGGPFVLAGNHPHWLDGAFLATSVKRSIHFLCKEELHKGPRKIIFKPAGTIPVNRSVNDTDAFKSAKEVLKNNRIIGLFPEAYCNKGDEPVLPFKTGAVRLAHETDTYLLPFTITGKYKLFRKTVTIEFHKMRKIETNDIKLENEKLMDFFREKLKDK